MEEIILFGELEVGISFEDNKGNVWMKTEEINWLDPTHVGISEMLLFLNLLIQKIHNGEPNAVRWDTLIPVFESSSHLRRMSVVNTFK